MFDYEILKDLVYVNKVVSIYQELNINLTKSIIGKLKENGDLSSFTKSQLKQLKKTGGKEIFKQTLLKTKGLSKQRKKEILDLFEEISQKDVESYKKLYDYRGKELELSERQLQIVNVNAKRTNKELENMTKTIAFSSQTQYVKAVDSMYMQVVTGGIDYQTAFRKTTNELAKEGIILIDKRGYKRSLEASVRQNVLTGIRDTVREINQSVGKELDCDGVQINISPNCRDDHKPINGQRFKLNSKEWVKYKDLLNDYNCQHYETPIIYDIEENIYSKSEIERANNRKVNYKGEKINYYEATQRQRAYERQVRKAKQQYEIEPNKENKTKVLNAQKNVRNYCNETGLERDYSREYFAGYNK